MGTRITGSTKRIDEGLALGRRTAEMLGKDPAVADLAPAIVQATERLVEAQAVRKAAADTHWVARQALAQARKALNAVLRAAQFDALRACGGDRRQAVFATLFPKGMAPLMAGSIARREQAAKALAERLAADPAQAEGAARMAAALAAWQKAMEACDDARRNEGAAVVALHQAARTHQVERRVARDLVSARLKDPVAARAYFPTVPGGDRATPEPEPGGAVEPEPPERVEPEPGGAPGTAAA